MTSVDKAYQKLIALVELYLTPEAVAQIRRAFERAYAAHGTATRKSGEPYITHPLAAAIMLAEMRMDADTVSAALLHDILEDTAATLDELKQEFGKDVAKLVFGMTKLEMDKVRPLFGANPTYDQIEEASLVNLFIAMAEDLRVITIKLCDRMHNMLTIHALKPEKQLRMARETLDLFAPLAARLGIWRIKKQLEDMSLEITNPDAYAEIKDMLQARSQLMERHLANILSYLRIRLADDGIDAEVGALPEHIYGLYRHIQAHGWESARTYDGLRIHVVVDTVSACYAALGSVHSLWQPIPGRMIDFIAVPKDGLYRSLHTVVLSERGHPLEVRIRTKQMHHLSEYGAIAYMQCPTDTISSLQPHPQVVLLKELNTLPDDNPQDFLDLFKSQITPHHIRVFTPKGQVMDLPAGATPIDFAYTVHTEIGHSCYKALVNGRFAPLDQPLRDGDQVEIIKSDTASPERTWLDLDLGYVNNPNTLRQIRRWFSRLPEKELVAQGRALVKKELDCWGKCVGWSSDKIAKLARKRGLSTRALCLRVGRGEISASELSAFVLSEATGWTENQVGPLTLEIIAIDRPNLLLDACLVIAKDNVNMERASALSSDEQGMARVQLTLIAKTLRQIVRIAHRLEKIPSVIQVRCIQLPLPDKQPEPFPDLPI